MIHRERFNEALDLIQEECAEVIQAISKIRRFGLDSINPYLNDGKTNLDHLVDEIGDLRTLIDYLEENEYISSIDILNRMEYKRSKLRGYSNLYDSDLHRVSRDV